MSTVKLLTWNVLAPVWIRSSLYPGVDEKLLDTSYRVSQIARHLAMYNADIVILQEIQCTFLDQIIKESGDIYKVYDCRFNLETYFADWLNAKDLVFPESREQFNGMALLVNKSFSGKISNFRVHPWESGNVNFSFDLGKTDPSWTYGKLEEGTCGKMSVFACHLDVGNIKTTMDQLSFLCKNKFHIIAGDLNLDAKCCKEVTSDPYDTVLPLDDKHITCADGRIVKQYDNILVLKDSGVKIGKIINANGKSDTLGTIYTCDTSRDVTTYTNYLLKHYGSDHLPICAELVLP